MRVGIVGAGFAGLSAAYDLARAGHEPVVFDALSRPGGLAAGFRDERWAWHVEDYYHHLFTSDDMALGLARQTGFGDKLLYRRPVTGSQYQGLPYALDGVGPVLTFPHIPFVDRVRMGLVIAYLKVSSDWRRLEHVTAKDWVTRMMGARAYRVIWEPLLIGKFGRHHQSIPMSWLWARLHKRSMRLIYFEGGFQAFADHLAAVVQREGASVRLGEPVREIRATVDGALEVSAGGQAEAFDRVIATVGPHLFARLATDLPDSYIEKLLGLDYLGAIVVVLALHRRLMPKVYWLSLDKREYPFLACVEHTNFVDSAHYGGEHVVYMGDYLEPGHRYFALSDEELLDEWLPALTDFNPAFERSWIRRYWVNRTSYAQPVVALGFSEHIPPLETPIDGLYLASMSQVYPWDRGTNYAVEIGRAAAARIVGG